MATLKITTYTVGEYRTYKLDVTDTWNEWPTDDHGFYTAAGTDGSTVTVHHRTIYSITKTHDIGTRGALEAGAGRTRTRNSGVQAVTKSPGGRLA